MASYAADPGDSTVSIGRIFGRTFGTVARNPVTTLAIAFLFGGLPTILLAYLVQKYGSGAPDFLGLLGSVLVSLAIPAATVAMAIITQGALVRATIAHHEGRKASFAESAASGLGVAVPLFVMAILSGAAIGLGLLLFVIPGVLLYALWSVAGPALVEERLGPLQALRRSRDLTRGARWKVLAVGLIAIVASLAASSAIGLVNLTVFDGPEDLMTPLGRDPRLPFLFYAVNGLFQTLSLAVWGVIQASLYVELREWKDGPQADALAEIFS